MTRTLRTLLVLAVALVAAFVASFAVLRALQRVNAQKARAATAPTVVASHPIPIGAVLTKDDVKLVAWPASSRVPTSFASADQVVGRGTMANLSENEPVIESKLAPKGVGGGLPPTIPAGMRAVSIRVNDVIGVAGFIVPGSRVDVLVTVDLQSQRREKMTRVVVSNVEVLTAGTRYDQDEARKEAKPMPTTVVTLMVTPEDAERIALAQNEGKITLTLRNPLDKDPSQTPGARLASLLGKQTVAPEAEPTGGPVKRRAKPAKIVLPPPPPEPKPYTVETIRGAKRTEEIVR